MIDRDHAVIVCHCHLDIHVWSHISESLTECQGFAKTDFLTSQHARQVMSGPGPECVHLRANAIYEHRLQIAETGSLVLTFYLLRLSVFSHPSDAENMIPKNCQTVSHRKRLK